MAEMVNHPDHYNQGPKCEHCQEPIECINVIEEMSFSIGNAVKYLWRAGKKDPKKHIEDLEKAIWYIENEIKLIQKKQKIIIKAQVG